MAVEPMTITLRYLQTLTEIASEKNSTIIFPLPIELLNLLKGVTDRADRCQRCQIGLADDGFHEIQLSGKQLVFLFMATTIVAVSIFLCGVQVGRGVKAAPADDERCRRVGDAAAGGGHAVAGRRRDGAASGRAAGARAGARRRAELREASAGRAPARREAEAAQRCAACGAPSATPAAVATSAAATPKEVASAVTERRPSRQPRGQPAWRWIVQLRPSRIAARAAHARAAPGRQGLSGVRARSGRRCAVHLPRAGGRLSRPREADQAARRLEKEEQFKPWISHSRSSPASCSR